MRNLTPLQLHIPLPIARPGDAASFAHIDINEAGSVRRPDSAAPEAELRDLPYTLIRVLDDEGQAIGPWVSDLSADVMRKGLRAMLLTRIFDERLYRAQRQGKTSFYMKSTGEEAISVAQSLAMGSGDMCFPTYRVMGWLHARDYPLLRMVNQI